MGMVFMMKYK